MIVDAELRNKSDKMQDKELTAIINELKAMNEKLDYIAHTVNYIEHNMPNSAYLSGYYGADKLKARKEGRR